MRRVTPLALIIALITISYSDGFVVPESWPSALTVIYSKLPPFKKGTDSRIGWGFALGRHAEFQSIIELGPQTETKPIGRPDDDSDQSKREAPQQAERRKKDVGAESEGARWLREWSETTRRRQRELQEPIEGEGEIDAALVLPPDDQSSP